MHTHKGILYLLLICFATIHLNAQNYRFENDIVVKVNGNTISSAWAGGLNSPQFSPVDLDNDGTLDLVVFDRYDDIVLPFINGGTSGQVDYTFAPEYRNHFPSDLRRWMLMRDYDGDGLLDIFTALTATSNIRVFRNISATNGNVLAFSIAEDTILTDYPGILPLYSAKSDIPAITDVDGDGDMDIITFSVGGKYVEWHRNTSMEVFGDLTHLEYVAQSRCFGHFEEDGNQCTPYLGLDPCGPGQRLQKDAFPNEKTTVHAGSTLLALDLTGNGLKDLVVGDIECHNFYALRNAGTLQIAHFDFHESNFPASDIGVDIPVFPGAFYMDVDNDGLRDLISAPNQTTNIEDKSSVWFHKNNGTNTLPDFNFVKTGLVQDEMIETGSASVPVFFDHNADGLQDLLIGNLGRWDSLGDYTTSLQLWENKGSAQVPIFELVDEDYLGLASNVIYDALDYVVPATGDLDGDGDPDLLLGDASGDLLYFENTASQGNPAVFSLVSMTYQNINADLYSAPELFDLDNDQDLDLLIGNIRGKVLYYENTGSSSTPVFTLVSATFGNVNITDFTGNPLTNGYAKPRMIDYDGDGDAEMLVGGLEGGVMIFDDVSLNTGATFTESGLLYYKDFGKYAAITAAVLDSSRLTYVAGNYRGGLSLLRYEGPVKAVSPVETTEPHLILYPNPVGNRLKLELQNSKGSSAQLSVFSVHRKRVFEATMHGNKLQIDLSELEPGIYIVLLETGKHSLFQKFVRE